MHEKTHTRSIATAILTPLAALFLAASLFASCSSPSSGSDDPAVETPVTETPVTETPVTETPVKSSVCTLSALTVSAGTLVPAFDPAVTSYTVDVESSVKSITVAGKASDPKATVSESGMAARSLSIGNNTIVLTVTAENGTAKAYTVTAFRKPVVYAAGTYSDGSQTKPCYWKDATRVSLDVPAGSNADAYGICIADGSVYVCGFIYGTINTPCYWKDGIRTDLSTEGVDGCAIAITVANGSVYVAGYYEAASNDGKDAPCYWKDGVLTELDHPDDTGGNANAIAVSGGEVYTAGYFMTNDYEIYVCYWKGTAKTALSIPSTSTCSYAKSIVISGGSVYIAGLYSTDYTQSDTKGAWWKDGTRTDVVATGATATWLTSIVLDNGTVYLSGGYVDSTDLQHPVMWKGSEQLALTEQGTTYPYATCAVLDGRAYCASQTKNATTTQYVACVWEEGVLRELETSVNSNATAIALGE